MRSGGIAQLGERLNGIQEVTGSIPVISTKTKKSVFFVQYVQQMRIFCSSFMGYVNKHFLSFRAVLFDLFYNMFYKKFYIFFKKLLTYHATRDIILL